MMTDLQKELDQAFSLISAIPVSGEGVELMAAAREKLRKAFKMAEEKETEKEKDG